MKKIDLGQTIGILANIGVVAGIVFLAVQIDQNNDQLAAQTRNTIFELRSGLARDQINNVGGIFDVQSKERRGEALTDVEVGHLSARRFHVIRIFEYMVQESPDYALAQAPLMAASFRQDPALMEFWGGLERNGDLDEEFVTFMETNVFPRLNR